MTKNSMRQSSLSLSLSLSLGRGSLSVFGVSGRMALCGHSVSLSAPLSFVFFYRPRPHACEEGEILEFSALFLANTSLICLYIYSLTHPLSCKVLLHVFFSSTGWLAALQQTPIALVRSAFSCPMKIDHASGLTSYHNTFMNEMFIMYVKKFILSGMDDLTFVDLTHRIYFSALLSRQGSSKTTCKETWRQNRWVTLYLGFALIPRFSILPISNEG